MERKRFPRTWLFGYLQWRLLPSILFFTLSSRRACVCQSVDSYYTAGNPPLNILWPIATLRKNKSIHLFGLVPSCPKDDIRRAARLSWFVENLCRWTLFTELIDIDARSSRQRKKEHEALLSPHAGGSSLRSKRPSDSLSTLHPPEPPSCRKQFHQRDSLQLQRYIFHLHRRQQFHRDPVPAPRCLRTEVLRWRELEHVLSRRRSSLSQGR